MANTEPNNELFIKAAMERKVQDFQDSVAKHNKVYEPSNPRAFLRGVGWLDNLAKQAKMCDLAEEVLARAAEVGVATALELVQAEATRELLQNYHRSNSSSGFSNATNEAVRAALSEFINLYI